MALMRCGLALNNNFIGLARLAVKTNPVRKTEMCIPAAESFPGSERLLSLLFLDSIPTHRPSCAVLQLPTAYGVALAAGSTPPLTSTAGLEAAIGAVAQEIAAVVKEIVNVEKKIEVMEGKVDSATDAAMKGYMMSTVTLLREEKNMLRGKENMLRAEKHDKEAALLQLSVNAGPPASTVGA